MAYRNTIKNVGKEIQLGAGNLLTVAVDAHADQESQAVISVKGWFTAKDGTIAHAKARVGALTPEQAAQLAHELGNAVMACNAIREAAVKKIAASAPVVTAVAADPMSQALALFQAGRISEETLRAMVSSASPAPVKRTRRTKAEMAAARAAEATKEAAEASSTIVERLLGGAAALVPASKL